MKTNNFPFISQALLAAVFFGVSAPLSKLLLDDVPPIFLASFLYLGSGTGITLTKLALPKTGKEARIKKGDVKWLAGAIICGGIAAPILLMLSLENTPASTASLLLNFEGVATTLIAMLVFREALSRRAWSAITVITLASIFLSTNFDSGWGLSLGALGVLLATTLWGADNNLTRNISGKDPLAIVAWKGLVAGTFSFLLAFTLGERLPPLGSIAWTMLLGWISYGLSTFLFIRSMGGLGAARTSALYGTAPLAGVLLSLFIFSEDPSMLLLVATVLMLGGAYLLVNEEHRHSHVHTAIFHEHGPVHNDPLHGHDTKTASQGGGHQHEAIVHEHEHLPDIHHRHEHEKDSGA